MGGFGFTDCCNAVGSGIGFGVPVGGPTVAEASDQYVTSALIKLSSRPITSSTGRNIDSKSPPAIRRWEWQQLAS